MTSGAASAAASGSGPAWRRRTLLAAAAAWPGLALDGCSRDGPALPYDGGWVGASVERGHRLRGSRSGAAPAPEAQRRASVLVVGAGVAGLGAARALMRAGVDDIRVFDLEDAAGGNSRGHAIAGMACPLGAHYLPVPGEAASEVAELLTELGVRRTEHGVAVYDERTLCHSPPERLLIDGHWHEGLLPPIEALPPAQRATTLAAYRRFGALVEQIGQRHAFSIPTARSRWSASLDALDAVTFTSWLDANGLTAPALRWYLDYCCRDDYGAGAAQVSAWAGLHYFASRHGFQAPGEASDAPGGVLTWPEGNAWLSRRLAAPLGDRLRTASTVVRIDEGRFDVSLDVLDVATQRVERWTAPHAVIAVPLFIATRLLVRPPAALVAADAGMRHAPWLVGNLHIAEPLDDRPGAPPSWDNVRYDIGDVGDVGDAGMKRRSLGYVDAMHQSTRSVPGPTVLTAYWALGGDTPSALTAQRAALLAEPWQAWSGRVVDELAVMHPDLHAKLKRVDLMRYGHAMCIPTPGLRSSAALQTLAAPQRRVHFAHGDLSAYSVFEEALYQGGRAASQLVRRGGSPSGRRPNAA